MRIGDLLSASFAMLRARFWPLAGLTAVFFAIQMAAGVLLVVSLLVVGPFATSVVEAGLRDPVALIGMGAGMIAFVVLFYGAYLVLVLAHQAALVAMASPLGEPTFGAALARGMRSAVPFAAIGLVGLLAYALLAAVSDALAAAAGSARGVVETVFALALLPGLAWLGCRLAVLVPVIAVEQVFAPLAALRRTFALTRGKAGDIFLALLAFGVVAVVLLGGGTVAIGLMIGTMADYGGVFIAFIGVFLFAALIIAAASLGAAYVGQMHSQLTGGGAESLEEVFA